MAEAFFKVRLTLDITSPANPALIPPDVLRGFGFSYLIVREGGEEAIVEVSAPADALTAIEKSKQCERLSAKQFEALRKSYPAPKLKKKYRVRNAPHGARPAQAAGGRYELDSRGEKIADTYQTVRCDFHLIDVLVSER